MKIKDFEKGTQINTPLLINNVVRGVTQNGAPYLSIMFQDNTGQIEAKWWDVSEEIATSIVSGKIGLVKADVLLYRQALQLRVHSIDFTEKYDLSEFVVASEHSTEFLQQEISNFVNMIENPIYKEVVEACFERLGEDFYLYPAATRNHHDFVGGLATHVYGMCSLAVEMKKLYPILNLDLLLAGVLIHDMGKVEEYTEPILSEYSVSGKLLGHISIIHAELYDIAKDLGYENTEEVMLLRHLVLAHHGQLEFGSPVRPLVIEAEILNFIDNIDARMNMFEKIYNDLDEGQFAPRAFALENRSFYKPKGVK